MALPTEITVESGTSQSKSGTPVNLIDSGKSGFNCRICAMFDGDTALPAALLAIGEAHADEVCPLPSKDGLHVLIRVTWNGLRTFT